MAEVTNVSTLQKTQEKVSLKTKNILLLNPGGSGIMMRGLIRERPTQFGFCWPSVDLIVASGLLNASGHRLSYVDASIDGISAEEISQKIKKDDIEAVVSLYSHFTKANDVRYLSRIKALCPEVPIVILPDIQHVLFPQRAFDFLAQEKWLDAIILSLTSNHVDRYLSGDRSPDLINLCYRIDGKVHLGPKDIIAQNDYALPIPRHDLFKNKKYFLPQSRDIYVTTTTMQFGCPYECDFCLDKEAYKKSWCRSPENMLAEMEYIVSCGFNEVYFRDLTFGLNRPRTIKFLKMLIDKKLPLQWVCTTRVDTVNEELLTLMKQAGCICIEFGVESGLDRTKDIHKKGTKNEQAIKTFEICRRLGIETAMFMILGFPDESMEDLRNSIQFAFDLKGDFISLNMANVLPETDFEKKAQVKKNTDVQEQNPWENYNFNEQNFAHPTISRQDILKLRNRTMRQFYLRPSYILNRLLKMKSLAALLRVCRIGWKVIVASFTTPKATAQT